MGLYLDDELVILQNIVNQQTNRENAEKKIISIIKSVGFKIEITANLTEVNFLDVTFNLEQNTYRPYKLPIIVITMITYLMIIMII